VLLPLYGFFFFFILQIRRGSLGSAYTVFH
jgi:hypothetical protein